MRQQQALQVAVTTERKNRNYSNFRSLLLLRIRIDAPVFSIIRRSYQAALDQASSIMTMTCNISNPVRPVADFRGSTAKR